MMKLVIDIDDSLMPFVRQQARMHGPGVRLDFEHFPAVLPVRITGIAAESLESGDTPLYTVTPLEEM